jgi:hypothetical protein
MRNKKIDKIMSGTTAPSSPTDEMVWINTTNNTISRYNETLNSWVSVGGGNGGNANTGDITFDGIQIIGAGNASGDGLNAGTIRLVPDADLNTDQYLIIDPTAPNHIHIRAGGTQDASTSDLIIGAENTNLLVSDTGDYVDVRTTSASPSYTNIWRFTSDGYFTGPAMGGLFVSGLLNGNNDLWLGSSNDSIVLSPGSGSAFIGDTNNPNNQIAKLSDRAYVRVNVPTSSLGVSGHVTGMVADDATYHYYCTANYNGSTHIWKRVTWTVGTWGV